EMWEKAIQLSKELADMYENKIFDYEGLGNLLKKRATFYENIMKAMRPQPEYFAVGYYGQGFPSFLRNKMFIYRGKEYERREDFNLKLLTQFPGAEKMTSTAPPGEDIKASPKQFVQCFLVKPVMNLPPNYKDKPVPEQILNYYRANEVQQFTHSRPVRKGEKDPDNEFANSFLNEGLNVYSVILMKVYCVYHLPQEEISPLENAIEMMEVTNEKITNIVQQHIWDRSLPVHPLSMLLNGIVDPAVMGGYTNYEKAFFTEKYLQEHPEDQDKIELLKQQIAIQMPLLAEGIRIHGEKLTEQLKPLHDRLTSCFRELKKKVEKQYGVITLPPSLTERKPSRSGSVVLPYIMSSTLRRLSVTSVASSVVSTSSTSSDSTSSRPGSDGSILEPLLERRTSASSRPEDVPMKEDGDNRISKGKRKEWSISKSQVIVERE
ncbi:Dedicator of cytokinesis protein 5, partial [Acanthisitta chloris]